MCASLAENITMVLLKKVEGNGYLKVKKFHLIVSYVEKKPEQFGIMITVLKNLGDGYVINVIKVSDFLVIIYLVLKMQFVI